MRYETHLKRALAAILFGAGLGGLFFAIPYAFFYYTRYGWEFFIQYTVTNATGIFMLASLIWLVGIVAIGVPIWIWLHKNKLRDWWVGCLVGAVLPAVLTFLLQTRFLTGRTSGSFSSFRDGKQMWVGGTLTTEGWLDALISSAWMGFGGLIIGWLIWRIAYRRIDVQL